MPSGPPPWWRPRRQTDRSQSRITRLASSSRGPEHTDIQALSGIAQIAILECERSAEPHRQLEVSGVISRQPFLPREIEHTGESACRGIPVDDYLDYLQQSDQFRALRRGYPSAALGQRESIGNLQVPEA